jgi:hypothetical protein
MSSSLDALELVKFLTMKDLITEAGSLLMSFEKRSRAKLIEAITQSAELQAVVRRAYQRKKEHQAEEKEGQLKRAHFDDIPVEKEVDAEFLRNPTEDVKREALASFIDRTGNAATRFATCMSCARELYVEDMQKVFVDELPKRYLLTPIVRHQAQVLVHGALLDPTSISCEEGRPQGPICRECLEDLQVGNVPVHSLVNGLWVGPVRSFHPQFTRTTSCCSVFPCCLRPQIISSAEGRKTLEFNVYE